MTPTQQPQLLPPDAAGPARRRGMTLIEVLVSAVILGVGVAGLLSVASLALRNQQRVEHRSAAVWLAHEKLAEVELEGPYSYQQAHPTRGTQEQGEVIYSWTLTIEPISVGDLYSVRAKVEWTASRSGGQVELETWLNDSDAETLPEDKQQAAGDQVPPGR